MLKQETTEQMRTLQPKKQVEGGTEHDGQTPHKVEKGNGKCSLPLPAGRGSKAAHGSAAQHRTCCRMLPWRPQGARGLKFRDKRKQNKPLRDRKDQALALAQKAAEPQFAGGRGKTRRKYHRTLVLFFSSSPSVCRCWRQDTGPDGTRLYQVRLFSGGLSGSCS